MATSGLASFALLVVSMGIGTLVCGLIPLSLPLSRRALRVLEVFSAGLLIGAAVTVVIPEGAKALFESGRQPAASLLRTPAQPVSASALGLTQTASSVGAADARHDWAWSFISKRDVPPSHDHDGGDDEGHKSSLEQLLGSSILCGFLLMFAIDQVVSSGPGSHDHHQHHEQGHFSHAHHTRPATPRRPEAHRLSRSYQHRRLALFAQVAEGNGVAAENGKSDAAPHAADHAHTAGQASHSPDRRSSSSDPDHLPDDYDDERYGSPSSKFDDGSVDWSGATNRNSATLARSDSSAPLLASGSSGVSGVGRQRKRRGSSASHASSRSGTARDSFRQVLTTLVGLLIHAFADGIAMGASAGSGDSSLTLIVLFAIMVHKAPAAFGLCTLLISQRLSRSSIRKGVAVFSIASPLGAVTTYLVISLFFGRSVGGGGPGGAGEEAGIDGKHIGMALLFSGGTFLFVAMHAILELAGEDADMEPITTTAGAVDTTALPVDEEAQRHHHSGGNGVAEAVVVAEREVLGKVLRMVLVALGAWTPRLLQKAVAVVGGGHHHHHR